MKMLNEKTIDQITVKDIADECGINRNTFYYHYSSIPELVEKILVDAADRIINNSKRINSMEMAIFSAMDLVQTNRKAAYNLFSSNQRDVFERCLLRICEHVAKTYLETALPDINISEEDRMIIIAYYRALNFGVIIDWIEHGMKATVVEHYRRFEDLRKGHFEEMIKRAEETKK